MISSDSVVIITFNEEDRLRIREARRTLEEILDAFNKAGGYNDTEGEDLTATIHILNKIERGETF